MPIYTFFCDKCKMKFEHVCSIREYSEDSVCCSSCESSKSVHRLYLEDAATLSTSVKKSDSELKTVGDLALRNTDRLSDDQKAELTRKHNAYKNNKEPTELPKGMSRPKTPKQKIKWT